MRGRSQMSSHARTHSNARPSLLFGLTLATTPSLARHDSHRHRRQIPMPRHGVAPDTKVSAHVRCALSRTHLEDAPHCLSQLVAYGRVVAYVDISLEPRVLVTISGWDDSREFDK